MTAVVAIVGPEDTSALASTVARQLSGPTVVLPYDDLLNGWIVKPSDSETMLSVTGKQVKLLVAGYVRAGFQVVIHGSMARDGRRDEGAIEETLTLMRTVQGVQTLGVGLHGVGQAGIPLEGSAGPVGEIARRIFEAIPLVQVHE